VVNSKEDHVTAWWCGRDRTPVDLGNPSRSSRTRGPFSTQSARVAITHLHNLERPDDRFQLRSWPASRQGAAIHRSLAGPEHEDRTNIPWLSQSQPLTIEAAQIGADLVPRPRRLLVTVREHVGLDQLDPDSYFGRGLQGRVSDHLIDPSERVTSLCLKCQMHRGNPGRAGGGQRPRSAVGGEPSKEPGRSGARWPPWPTRPRLALPRCPRRQPGAPGHP
jgi:hypothetical protein